MSEVVLLFRVPVVGPGPWPSLLVPSEISEESLRRPDVEIQFDSIYRQTLLLAGSNVSSLKLRFDRLPESRFTLLKNYWKAVGGMDGTFAFAHPVTGETKRMRFAQEILKWEFHSPGRLFDVEVELEEAP